MPKDFNYAHLASELSGDRFVTVACSLCDRPTLILAGFGDRVICQDCEGVKPEPPVSTVKIDSTRPPFDVPPLYRYDPKKYPPASVAKLQRVLNWPFGPKGLILNGTTGKGKTIAMYQLCVKQHNEGRSIEHMTAAKFGYEVSASFGSFESPAFLRKISTCDIFFLDDLGNSKITERVAEALFHVTEERTKNLRPILCTTNYVGETLLPRFEGDIGAAFVRRLQEYSYLLNF